MHCRAIVTGQVTHQHILPHLRLQIPWSHPLVASQQCASVTQLPPAGAHCAPAGPAGQSQSIIVTKHSMMQHPTAPSTSTTPHC